ncbi:hypothetical protein BDV93DRAFT_540205 [Ceratobasidium sp. AG-I]|nr:hypothetical protein BDV93DRAFT_540205 [Ceratobasidium sp. AG-I]
MAKFIPIPLTSQQTSCEVWARMPDINSASGESNVELMAIVLDSQSHLHMRAKTYSCIAPESRDIWSTSAEEVVHGVRSLREPLSDGATFRYRQTVGISPEVEWWQGQNGSRETKIGVILAGWCETDDSLTGAPKKYTYWVRCERGGAHITHRWYEQHELFAWSGRGVSVAPLSRRHPLA